MSLQFKKFTHDVEESIEHYLMEDDYLKNEGIMFICCEMLVHVSIQYNSVFGSNAVWNRKLL